MTPSQINYIFTEMKKGTDITLLLDDDATSKDYYFFIKAYKLVNLSSFFSYCQPHKLRDGILDTENPTDFLQMLYNILDENYPPLEPNHKLEDGYAGLDFYVQIAETIFKDA